MTRVLPIIKIIVSLVFMFLLLGVVVEGQEGLQNEENTAASEETTVVEARAPSALTADQLSIINSIKVSTNYDLLLWVEGLGLEVSNDRKALQSILLSFYGLPTNALEQSGGPAPVPESDVVQEDDTLASGTTDEIIIRRASNARYFTYDKIKEDIFILQGNVEILINQKNEKRQHLIYTDKLIYNETTRNGTALGNITYKVYEYQDAPLKDLSGTDPIEEFLSQVISFNIDSFNADVLLGITSIEKNVNYGKDKNISETLLFRIYSPHISRAEDIITISNATFTSSKAIPPIYSIKLKKMWLLTPDEWAVSNASVYLGEIPVMWIPFFVNPGDKFFFHPSIGYKTRTGGFINTTTYILGEHQAASSDKDFLDLFNISKRKSGRKIIKGLYLREVEPEDDIRNYPSDWLLRYILDYYTGLGAYTALEANLPGLWVLNSLETTLGFAITETVYNVESQYFNYYINDDGYFERNWDNGYLFNLTVPFRYQFKLRTGVSIQSYYRSSLNFEQYSDSYLDRDFSQRLYDFSWDEILDPNKKIEELNTRSAQKSSYYWQWDNSGTVPLYKWVGNYVRSFSISSFLLQVNWSRKQLASEFVPDAYTKGVGTVEHPIESYFFYPSQLEFPSYQVRMSGTLFSLDTTNLDFYNGVPRPKKRPKNSQDDTLSSKTEKPLADMQDTDAQDTDAQAEGEEDVTARQDGVSEDLVSEDTRATDTQATDTQATDTQDTDTQATDAQDTDAQDTDAQDTDAQDTDAQDTDAQAEGEEDVTARQDGVSEDLVSEGNLVAGSDTSSFEDSFDSNEEIIEYTSSVKSPFEVVPLEEDTETTSPSRKNTVLRSPEFTPKSLIVKNFVWNKFTYDISYSLTQALNEIIYYNASEWERPEDIQYFSEEGVDYAYLTNTVAAQLINNISALDSWITYKYTLDIDLRYRNLNYDVNLEDQERERRKKSGDNYTTENLSNSHRVTLYPLKFISILDKSNVSYSANFDLGKHVFSTVEEATWYEEDDEEWWNSHNVAQAYILDFAAISQTASMTVNLPPLELRYLYAYALTSQYFSLSLDTAIQEDRDTGVLSYDPLDASARIGFFNNNLSFTQNISYEYEFDYIESLSSRLRVWWLSSTLNYEYGPELKFDSTDFLFTSPNIHDKELRIKSLINNLNYTSPSVYFWRDRVSLNLNTSMSYTHDFQRFINTSFTWSYGINIAIHQFINLQFSTSIRNDVLYLYFQEYTDQIGIETRDFWKDIVNGFSFGDEAKLRDSAFKVGTINFKVYQDFGGWIFSFSYRGEPKRVTGSTTSSFEWNNTIQISVYWKPLPELKSEAFFREEEWSLEEDIE